MWVAILNISTGEGLTPDQLMELMELMEQTLADSGRGGSRRRVRASANWGSMCLRNKNKAKYLKQWGKMELS